MKVLGLITEYNPFHNGHLHHLEASKKLSNHDFTVCVMSGNFIQRGEPAFVNKQARTKMALLSGVDLVLELPTVFSLSSAEYFAFGAVKILDSLGIIDSICFGTENGRLDELFTISEMLSEEPENYKKLLKSKLNAGNSFATSREYAIIKHLESIGNSYDKINAVIKSSNNILGIEYLKALKKLNSRIIPLTIKREGNSYNSSELNGSISSATAIRKNFFNAKDTNIDDTVRASLPEASIKIIEEEDKNGRGPLFLEDFDAILLSSLRTISASQLKNCADVSEGLENRIKAAANNSGSLYELIEKSVSKRYTRTRIQRILLNSLVGSSKADMSSFINHGGPMYIRVLGFNRSGRELLSKMKKTASLPIITRPADFKASSNLLLRRMLEIESISTDLYVLLYKNPEMRKAGQEFTQNVIFHNN